QHSVDGLVELFTERAVRHGRPPSEPAGSQLHGVEVASPRPRSARVPAQSRECFSVPRSACELLGTGPPEAVPLTGTGWCCVRFRRERRLQTPSPGFPAPPLSASSSRRLCARGSPPATRQKAPPPTPTFPSPPNPRRS